MISEEQVINTMIHEETEVLSMMRRISEFCKRQVDCSLCAFCVEKRTDENDCYLTKADTTGACPADWDIDDLVN